MKKILITEDDRKISAALEIRLKAAGYEVRTVADGLHSYLLAATWKPDLILMDICIPVGSGLAVAQELKDSGLDDIPIIFITASKRMNLKELAGKLNAAGFIEKPFDTEKLLAAISSTLQSKQATKEGILK
jgi:DNA-binding response OmpR family regulator